jgi:membrane fusion protein (multidrug efflux system)
MISRRNTLAVISALMVMAGASEAGVPAAGIPPSLPDPRMDSVLPPVDSARRARLPGEGVSCMVEPHVVAEVGSAVDGVIEQVLVNRGDRVKAGQVVARLKAGIEEAEVEVRRAKLEFGKRKSERNEDLFKKQLISAQEMDEMETEYKVSIAELARAEEQLKLRSIVSPLNGVVVERYLWSGELIRADKSKVVKLAQVDPLNIEVVAPMGMFGSVSIGSTAEVSMDPLVKGSHRAKVVIVDRVIDAASSTFGIRLELPNPDNRIPAGIRCRIRFR